RWQSARSLPIWRSSGKRAAFKQHMRGAAIGSIAERNHGGMFLQHRVYDFPLRANTAAVNDADFVEASLNRLIQILFHHDLDFLRLERVEINGVFDRNLVHPIQYN